MPTQICFYFPSSNYPAGDKAPVVVVSEVKIKYYVNLAYALCIDEILKDTKKFRIIIATEKTKISFYFIYNLYLPLPLGLRPKPSARCLY